MDHRPMSARVFTARDVESIGMPVAIDLMREAFQLLSEGKVRVPLRTTVETDAKSGVALFMPSYAPTWKLFGLKMVSVFSGNEAPIPTIQGQMLLMSAEDGSLLAMIDAPAVTVLRTGAASGLATELLASHDASTLAVFGTGAQAWTQVAAVLAVRKIKEIWIKGTSSEKEKKFCKSVSDCHGIGCKPLNNLNSLQDADIICTATNSNDPLFELNHIRPGVHINAIGAYKPHMRELSEDIIAGCKLVVDHREAVLHEAGEIVIPVNAGRLAANVIAAELGEVVAGKKVRTSKEDITVFKSVGNAIQDLAIARYLLERLMAKG